MPAVKRVAIAIGIGGALTIAAACSEVAGLDVDYVASSSKTADGGGEGGTLTPSMCPCDQTQGFGCCISPTGASCAQNQNVCGQAAAGAMFVACQANDPNTESMCCWSSPDDAGSASVAAFASDCGARPIACVRDQDCVGAGGSGHCNLVACAKLTLGACDPSPAPQCPSGT